MNEKEQLELTLSGVMRVVDKWLDGEELEQDEVTRAITMREKTLKIAEERDYYKEELDRLRKVIFDVDVIGEIRQKVRRVEERIIELKKKLVE